MSSHTLQWWFWFCVRSVQLRRASSLQDQLCAAETRRSWCHLCQCHQQGGISKPVFSLIVGQVKNELHNQYHADNSVSTKDDQHSVISTTATTKQNNTQVHFTNSMSEESNDMPMNGVPWSKSDGAYRQTTKKSHLEPGTAVMSISPYCCTGMPNL